MPPQDNSWRWHNSPFLEKTCDQWHFPRHLVYIHIIWMAQSSIWALEYIPTRKNFFFVVWVLSIIFQLWWKPISTNLSTTGLGFWPSTLAMSTMNHFQGCHLDARSLIRATKQSIIWSHCLGRVPCLLLSALGLGNRPDALFLVIFFPLCCQATLLLQIPYCICCQLVDSNAGVLSPEVGMLSGHLNSVSICDNWFSQPQVIPLHFKYSTVVIDSVLDIKWSVFQPSIRSVGWIVKGDAMQYQWFEGCVIGSGDW